MRWSHETRQAAEHDGWAVVETDGVSDYQGWGVHLLSRPDAETRMVLRDLAEEMGGTGEHPRACEVRGSASHCEWAVLSWSYGSCGGCDSYEDRVPYDASPERCFEVFGGLIESAPSEEDARMLFSSRKGW